MPLALIATKLAALLSRISEGFAAALIAFMVVINGTAVFYRFVLNSPVGWSEEILRYCLIWATFIAAGAVLRAGEHFSLDLAGTLTSVRLKSLMTCLVYLLVLGFCLVIAVLGYQVAMRNQFQVSPVLEISMMWPYLAIPIGAGLTALEAALLLIAAIRSFIKPA